MDTQLTEDENDCNFVDAETGILYRAQVSGTEFKALTEGRKRGRGKIEPPSVAMPQLPQFSGKLEDRDGPANLDDFLLFLALGEPTLDKKTGHMLRPVLGEVTLILSSTGDDDAWLFSVSVDPAWQGKGIARKLLTLMADYLDGEVLHLIRLHPTEQGRQKLQLFLDQLLHEYGVRWTQNYR